MDSDARKNRSGTIMEGILERHVAKIAQKQGLEWKAQATASFIKSNWGIEVLVDKSERRFDVAVYSRERHKVWLIETNYYGAVEVNLKRLLVNLLNLIRLLKTQKMTLSLSG